MRTIVLACLIVLMPGLYACSTKPASSPAATNFSSDESEKLHRPLPPPDLNSWLQTHPRIAKAIKWQNRPGSPSDPYSPPDESDKTAWPDWPRSWKDDLNLAYLEVCAWFARGAPQVPMERSGLTDEPLNLHPGLADDELTAQQWVGRRYMWKLYIAHVAFSLAEEVTGRLDWSISDYDNESLRYLFDSSTMAWNISGERFRMGTDYEHLPLKRRDNLPKTAFAPPTWIYPFLEQAHLIGPTRIDTIARVLEWMRRNVVHFYGNNSYGTYGAVWQYRGYPPLSKIVNGTVDTAHPQLGRNKWTAGCHGSVGFLNAVLRVVNIPVQPVWICEHELPYFMTENLYMDHGDDPYNDNVKNSNAPVLSLLIDEGTYESWFTRDRAVNITDIGGPACRNVGRRIVDFIR